MAIAAGDKRLLVTVGTTRFDALLAALADPGTARRLVEAGYVAWRVQHGASPRPAPPAGVQAEIFDYKPTLEADIEWADLVIGHAGTRRARACAKQIGAGTILDVLRGPVSGKGRASRPALIIVTNDALMDNHQLELAQELGCSRVCISCSAADLLHSTNRILAACAGPTQPLPEPNAEGLEAYLRGLLAGTA